MYIHMSDTMSVEVILRHNFLVVGLEVIKRERWAVWPPPQKKSVYSHFDMHATITNLLAALKARVMCPLNASVTLCRAVRTSTSKFVKDESRSRSLLSDKGSLASLSCCQPGEERGSEITPVQRQHGVCFIDISVSGQRAVACELQTAWTNTSHAKV